jgi:hypothetical protein
VGAVTSRTTLWAVAGIALALVLTGCRPEPAVEPTPTFSSEAEAFAAAEATYREYVKALNAVDLSDPETFEGVYAWTTGDLNASDRKGLTKYHADRVSVSGSSTIEHLSLGNGATVDDVLLAVCLNVSDIELVDANGVSLVAEDRADVQSLTIALTPAASSGTGLLLTAIEPREGQPECAP